MLQFGRPPSCRLTEQSQTQVTERQCFHQYQHGQCGGWGPPRPPTTMQPER